MTVGGGIQEASLGPSDERGMRKDSQNPNPNSLFIALHFRIPTDRRQNQLAIYKHSRGIEPAGINPASVQSRA